MKFLIIFVIYFIGINSNFMENSYDLDLNDILDENLMPGHLLLLDGPYSNETDEFLEKARNIEEDDGTFGTAFSTMGFHRKMINEYLCTNFIAEEILSSDANPMISTKLQRRTGTVDDVVENENEGRGNSKQDIKEHMLFDQGSSGYKNWLSKTTTLEDIYKHYSVKPKHQQKNSSNFTTNRSKINRGDTIVDRQDVTEDDYEEGEITGYAFHQPAHPIPTPQHYPSHHFPTHPNFYGVPGGQFDVPGEVGGHSHQIPAGSKAGVLSKGYYPASHEQVEEYEYHHEHEDKGSKEMSLKDIFDIALTTLAFLSFGMFILHVLMCITMTRTDNNLMMMPMEEGDVEEVGTAEVRRKRSTPIDAPSISQLNEITRKVLKSIESVLVAEKDKGSCLHRIICENNHFSRNHTDQKIWMPVWGLGLSWLSSRLITTQSTTSSIFECLRASFIGIGGANCKKMYPQCNLEIQYHERKLRRKKRETENYELKMNY